MERKIKNDPRRNSLEVYGEVLASSPAGIVVTVKEKYGPAIKDTATVVWWDERRGGFVLTFRDRPAAYYPKENYSITFEEEKK